MSDPIPDTPPQDEEGRAIWAIRRIAHALTGTAPSEEEGKALFVFAKKSLEEAKAKRQAPLDA